MHNFWVLILRNRDCTERMEQWYGNSPSSPIGLFIADLLLPCVKKKKIQIFKQPQSLKFLALLLSTKSREEKKNCIIIPSLSESRFS